MVSVVLIYVIIMLKLVQGKGSLPDGKSELEAEELLLTGVTRHHAGVYRCTASNGFGSGTSKVMRLVFLPR